MKKESTELDPIECLRHLMEGALQGRLKVEEFCAQFETVYNLRLDKAELNQHEASAFSRLFEQVVWYSPYPKDRARISNYKGDQDILSAISDAQQALESPKTERGD